MVAELTISAGLQARRLSASTATRLKQFSADDYLVLQDNRLGEDKWPNFWAHDMQIGLRAEDFRLYMPVIIGVNEQGRKRFLGIEDGVKNCSTLRTEY